MKVLLNMKSICIELLLLCLIFSCLGSCKPTQNEKPNIILIVPDALRAKQLPAYGYKKIKTPMIDDLAKTGAIFKYCFVEKPATPRSFTNLFSGSWSATTGLRNNEKTIAQYLKENGYYTVGFVSSVVMWSGEHPKTGRFDNLFSRGFDEYFQDISLQEPPYYRKNEDTTTDILNWLEKFSVSKSPFFLFVHYMDPHDPYEPSYDREIEKIDYELTKITEKLKQLDLYKKSLIVFTSDHGESLREHGSPQGHAWFLYIEQVQVPLIFKFPNNKYKKKLDQIVRNIDIMPTILDYTNIKYETEEIEGKSLLPVIEKNKHLDLISYHHTHGTRVCPEGSESIVFQDNDMIFQYIQGLYSSRYREFYNVSLDPLETNNLYSNHQYKELVLNAQELLLKTKKNVRIKRKSPPQTQRKLDERELRALKSLGYISDGAPIPFELEGPYVMNKNLNRVGVISYSDFIRKAEWGISLWDEYYPKKILAVNDNKHYVIADNNNKLFVYEKNKGFQSTGIENVKDIEFDRVNNCLYVLQSNKAKLNSIDANGTINTYGNKHINSALPCKELFIDSNNNFYLHKYRKIIKFDKDRKKIASYNITNWKNNQIIVDKDENIFIRGDNEIIKINKGGDFIRSFGKKEFQNGICFFSINQGEDGGDIICVLEKQSPTIHVFNTKGEKLADFTYYDLQSNFTKFLKQRNPIPLSISIYNREIYIVDNWEGILVYSLGL